ncbi:ATP-dependent DNA helicase [Phanerochaete sordida]|uniref:ATP-dependent DNA helicase n=1 Tax=Phanerochaete sordida TaxID=48140 RepID=A0A9P3GGR1_9APHY|nr:ATP-dependent DNA helicase [Phanerochaete sordida]
MNVQCPECSALHWDAEKTSDSRVLHPEFGICCDHGLVRLPALQPPPSPLRTLLTDPTSDDAIEFRQHIRRYNNALAFTSLHAKIDDRVPNTGRAPYVFRIHGQLCHMISSLETPDDDPKYCQLYIYDGQEALQIRNSRNSDLSNDTMAALQQMLLEHHRYAPIFRHAHEILQEHDGGVDVSLSLHCLSSNDRRRYNLPTADEVAVIIPDAASWDADHRDIVLRDRADGLMHISEAHPAYAPLHYVLLFPYGEHGWHWQLRLHEPEKPNPRKLTLTRWAAFRLHDRQGEFSTILRSGRLLQEFMVDMWAQADQERLRWNRANQSTIRAVLYSGLEDAVGAGGDNVDLNQVGTKVILPSSYIGGARHMHQIYQDSMAIARHYRKVDIFLTMTCNPAWDEILRELQPGQRPEDRPDLLSRVFKLKRDALLDDIMKHGIFGRAVAHVYTIEFQKRGLPHMHLLVWLRDQDKLRTPEDVDSCIRATWPDPVNEPLLFETVRRCMVHGPCGALNPHARCMEDGKCTKGFPKDFQSETSMDHNGYPRYRRPNDGIQHYVSGHFLDHRWIVPYSPYLSAKYDCHINVECAFSVGSVKYIHKYIFKGHDCATMEIHAQNDEIKQFLEGRYIGPSEAAWRIFHFALHREYPNVVRLQVHLPGQHMVVFDPRDNPEIVRMRAAQEKTTLTAFFTANSNPGELGTVLQSTVTNMLISFTGEIARQYTYQEFPSRFVWQRAEKRWTLRQSTASGAIGRMYYVSPIAGERFYLRTLLSIVKGPQSFEDLRTFNGVLLPTFRDACLARGLLEDDGEWRMCLRDATVWQTGSRLRQLFSMLLLHCDLTRPEELWLEFRESICDDLEHRLRQRDIVDPSPNDVYDYGLYLLDNLLRDAGHSLADFPTMPRPERDWQDVDENNRLIAEQLAYDREEQHRLLQESLERLNVGQRHAYDAIVRSIEAQDGAVFFLNGPAGTGKTFVYKTICYKARSEGLIVLCVASSGIAALLLPGGRTSHMMFRIPVANLSDISTCNINKQSPLADLIRRAHVVIWDEVPMQHRFGPEAADRTFKDLRESERTFGGLTVVFGGDFQQTLPVVPHGSREDIVEACLQHSPLWTQVKILHLRENMRLRGSIGATSFAQWLLDVGHGRTVDDQGNISIPDDLLSSTLPDLQAFVYGDLNETRPVPPPQYFLDRMILSARNEDANTINEHILECFPGEEATFHSADSVEQEGDQDAPPVPVEFLRSLNPSGLPPATLRLKPGCPVILLRNLAPARGLCNGTRLTIERMSDRLLEVRIMGGDHDGELAFIPRITLTPSDTAGLEFILRRRQFPVRLAFAMTINKSQGQSVKTVGIDLRTAVFGHGQLYVALSRATDRSRLRILLPADHPLGNVTANVVYPEVLLD